MKHFLLAVLLSAGTCAAMAQDTTKDSLVIHFDYNESAITPVAAASLDSLLGKVTAVGLQWIKLYGHCDFIGSHAYNDSLSLQRVLATKTWLQEKGINAGVFTRESGFGKRQPLKKGTTDAARSSNRRVVIVFEQQVERPITVVTEKLVADSANKTVKPATATTPPGPSMRLNDRGATTPDISKIIADPTVKAGSKLTLPNLYFEGGRHYLMPPSYPILKGLLQAMLDNPKLAIEIQGHICCEANGIDGFDADLRTRDLSVQRAKTVYNYLVENGIDESRLSYRGFGSSQKVFKDERTPEEQLKNRRVEIKILRK